MAFKLYYAHGRVGSSNHCALSTSIPHPKNAKKRLWFVLAPIYILFTSSTDWLPYYHEPARAMLWNIHPQTPSRCKPWKLFIWMMEKTSKWKNFDLESWWSYPRAFFLKSWKSSFANIARSLAKHSCRYWKLVRVSLSFARTWTLRTETRLLKDALQDKSNSAGCVTNFQRFVLRFILKKMYVLAVKSQPHMKPNSQCASTVLVNFPFWRTRHRVLRCSNAKISSSPSFGWKSQCTHQN